MKKHEIKSKVEAAVEKHIPKAIKEVARGRAYSAVHDALYEHPKTAAAPEGSPPTSGETPESPAKTTYVHSSDPRITGCTPQRTE
jgi:hypothetical protein